MTVAETSKDEEQANSRLRGTPFKQMSRRNKYRFVLQLTVCVLSFGFIFPNVMSS